MTCDVIVSLKHHASQLAWPCHQLITKLGCGLVQHCTLYGNATHIANTRYSTRIAKICAKWDRASYNLSLIHI